MDKADEDNLRSAIAIHIAEVSGYASEYVAGMMFPTEGTTRFEKYCEFEDAADNIMSVIKDLGFTLTRASTEA